MKNQLIKFSTAELAKQKGFDVPVYDYYDHIGRSHKWPRRMNSNANWRQTHIKYYSAPTQSLVQGWLREKHELFVYNIPTFDHTGWAVKVVRKNEKVEDTLFGNTWEDALEQGLFTALNLIDEKAN